MLVISFQLLNIGQWQNLRLLGKKLNVSNNNPARTGVDSNLGRPLKIPVPSQTCLTLDADLPIYSEAAMMQLTSEVTHMSSASSI